MKDADLSSALLLIRRAANKLARAHDAITLDGQPAPDDLPPRAKKLGLTAVGGSTNKGLFEAAQSVDVDPGKGGATHGEALVAAVARSEWGPKPERTSPICFA